MSKEDRTESEAAAVEVELGSGSNYVVAQEINLLGFFYGYIQCSQVAVEDL